MNVLATSDWTEVVDRLESGSLAPSGVADLPSIWRRAMPDESTVQRLARLELRFGSPVLAMDLACWALETFGDRPETRILAAKAALQGGLSATAGRLLRPLGDSLAGCDQAERRAAADAWHDLALVSGRMTDFRRAVLLEPSDADALTRMADDLWRVRDYATAIATYRWAACSGATVAKVYLRATSRLTGSVGLSEMINMMETAHRRTGEERFKAKLLELLLKADRRLDALTLLDGGADFAVGAEATAARDALVGYARAQLLAADAEALETTVTDGKGRRSAGQRQHHQAGRSLADAGWFGPAVWQIRKASSGSKP